MKREIRYANKSEICLSSLNLLSHALSAASINQCLHKWHKEGGGFNMLLLSHQCIDGRSKLEPLASTIDWWIWLTIRIFLSHHLKFEPIKTLHPTITTLERVCNKTNFFHPHPKPLIHLHQKTIKLSSWRNLQQQYSKQLSMSLKLRRVIQMQRPKTTRKLAPENSV